MAEWKHLRCGVIFYAKNPPVTCPQCNVVCFETGWAYLGPTPPGRIKGARRRRGKIGPFRRQNLYARDGNRCVECGEDDLRELTLDHIIPCAKGGTSEDDNLQTMCRTCNQKKANKVPQQA